MQKQNGFSIFELIVALSLIAILASIAMPSFISWRYQNKLSSAVNNLKADLQLAKSTAQRQNAMVAFVFAANGYRIFVDNGANAGDWIQDADEVLVKSKQLPGGVHISLPSTFDPPNNRTRFNGRGFPDPATLAGAGMSGAVTLFDSNGNQTKITINRLGLISES